MRLLDGLDGTTMVASFSSNRYTIRLPFMYRLKPSFGSAEASDLLEIGLDIVLHLSADLAHDRVLNAAKLCHCIPIDHILRWYTHRKGRLARLEREFVRVSQVPLYIK